MTYRESLEEYYDKLYDKYIEGLQKINYDTQTKEIINEHEKA